MASPTVTLWDPLVRVFHWSLVIIFVSNMYLNEQGGDWHQWLGYAAVVLLLVRFLWGFIGKGAARWSDFFPTPARLKQHVRALVCGEPCHRLGHSPLGALVMILMMLAVLALGITGYMMEEIDYFWGEDWVENLHGIIANSLLGLVIVHILAAVVESVRLRENLPLSMVTGKRRNLPSDD
ncbi:cytochrome b/b6 domain-containing protein [Cellvibrio japonicus]|uniref:Cytochrome b561 family protein n=1 Tax=Cellvibrio japonicus (strain Ueda107) TaxID=498211 RepID=B3PI61_CELJU|nr:cytochrome b/b6 domain-containing protein [Cellvibrio japonicus]ACE85367.1 cytochrome b561 family protein [Cellvibrio japonicus Ueda107]QEI11109.1 cytochrome B [Cellvibrio japonicus]QEI14683.1 cytochrome B [Cellvibrio japonicus]QEI18263.1 cytochrome B [Cellvibrio japonicus]